MPSSEDAATLAAYVAGVDRAAVEMETKWGMDRLPMLVSDDLRAKFNRQAASWSEAVAAAYDADRVTGAQMQAVTVKAAAMQRAWAALDAFAEEAGHRAIAPWVWEARLHDGSVAAVVQTNAEASKVISASACSRCSSPMACAGAAKPKLSRRATCASSPKRWGWKGCAA